MKKFLIICTITLQFLLIGNKSFGQLTFPELLNKAKNHNTEYVRLESNKKYLQLEKSKIKADNLNPHTYISSEVMLSPYFNNNREFISTNPSSSAIGYDIGITNGGLYSVLLNTEMSLFNRNLVNNLLEQNQLNISETDTKINALWIELKHTLAIQYLDALSSQVQYQNLTDKLKLLQQQLAIIKKLTDHGLYQYVEYRIMLANCTSDSIDLENSKTTYLLKLNQLKTTCGIADTSFTKLSEFTPQINTTKVDTSIFIQSFIQDSLTAVTQQKIFENQYKPHVNLYANTGLNSTSIPDIENHLGMSVGIRLTYPLFDRKQNQIHQEQQTILMDQAGTMKNLKQFDIQKQKESYTKAISSIEKSIKKEEKLQNDYKEILTIYNEELKNGQVQIIDYLKFIDLINQNKLTMENHKIERSKLIVELNYRNN